MPSAIIKLKDRWFRLIGIPLIAFMSHVIFFNENHGVADEAYSGWQVYLISVVEAIILWEGNRIVLIYFRKKYHIIMILTLRFQRAVPLQNMPYPKIPLKITLKSAPRWDLT